jgi:hypothetical protein
LTSTSWSSQKTPPVRRLKPLLLQQSSSPLRLPSTRLPDVLSLPRRLAHGQEAVLVDHFEELRSRLIVAGGAITVGATVAYVFHQRIVRWLIAPLPDGRHQLITFGVAEPFITSLKVSFAAGFALALPVVLWQLWASFAPVFEPRSERGMRAMVAFAGGLLVARVAFGYRVALPAALSFLVNYDTASTTSSSAPPTTSRSRYSSSQPAPPSSSYPSSCSDLFVSGRSPRPSFAAIAELAT